MSPLEAETIDSSNTQEVVGKRLENLFQKVKRRFPNLYVKDEKLKLNPTTLAYCIVQLQHYSISKTSPDILSSAYPEFLSKSVYGSLGQYFTPKPLVDLIVKLLDPKKSEKVLDAACGSGGFLSSILNYVYAGNFQNFT